MSSYCNAVASPWQSSNITARIFWGLLSACIAASEIGLGRPLEMRDHRARAMPIYPEIARPKTSRLPQAVQANLRNPRSHWIRTESEHMPVEWPRRPTRAFLGEYPE